MPDVTGAKLLAAVGSVVLLALAGCSAAGESTAANTAAGVVTDLPTGIGPGPTGTAARSTSGSAGKPGGHSTSATARHGGATASSRSTSNSTSAGGATHAASGTRSASQPGGSAPSQPGGRTSPPAPAPSTSAGPSAPALGPQLLTASDLPSGWAASDPGSSGSVSGPQCFTDATRTSQAADNRDAAFAKGGKLPALTESLGYYPGGSASSNFAASVSALDSCVGKQVTFTVDGTSLKGTFGSASVAAVGDESRAYKVNLSTFGFTLGLGIVVARAGHELLAVVYLNQNSADTGSLQTFSTRAAGKLVAS